MSFHVSKLTFYITIATLVILEKKKNSLRQQKQNTGRKITEKPTTAQEVFVVSLPHHVSTSVDLCHIMITILCNLCLVT